MYTMMIQGKKVKEYLAIWYPDGKREGDLLPIIADQAIIGLSDDQTSYALGYRTSRNLFGKTYSFVDLVNTQTGEAYSFQVENIFYLGVVSGDPKLIVRTKEGLKLYENFSRSVKNIEPDGDKTDLTPLGYYNMFVSFDDTGYYPEIFRANPPTNIIPSFYDYFGFQAYEDSMGKHFILFIESMDSTEQNPKWYFVDNFRIISDVIRFTQFLSDDSDEYVEDWWIDANGVINLKATTSGSYHLDSAGCLVKGVSKVKDSTFTFVKYFEDTDIAQIVGKNAQGYFIIDRDKTKLTNQEQLEVKYYQNFLGYFQSQQIPLFFFQSGNTSSIALNQKGHILYRMDFVLQKGDLVDACILQDGNLEITLSNGEKKNIAKT